MVNKEMAIYLINYYIILRGNYCNFEQNNLTTAKMNVSFSILKFFQIFMDLINLTSSISQVFI